MDPAAYYADFFPHFEKISDIFWKFERIQTFREPRNPSWKAFDVGDWPGSLRLIEESRESIEEDCGKAIRLGFEVRRLRVVEEQVAPYIQWEMHVLKIRAEAGDRRRVIDAEKLTHLEAERPLPEIVVLGSEVMYEVLYDGTGTLAGARRIIDSKVISDCRADLESLYKESEDLLTYFSSKIAPLPPPTT